MKQICKFDSKPSTINSGGYKKGYWVVWLNLNVSEIECQDDHSHERFQSVTDRLVLRERSIHSFIESVDPLHLAEASIEELIEIMKYFHAEYDIPSWKSILCAQSSGFYNSNHIKHFYLNDIQLWFDSNKRASLINAISIKKKYKESTTCLWYGGLNVNIDIDRALDYLYQLEMYSSDCFNVMSKHLVTIAKTDSLEDLMSYNIRSGYPEALRFKTE